jgi:hypothetical protein
VSFYLSENHPAVYIVARLANDIMSHKVHFIIYFGLFYGGWWYAVYDYFLKVIK